MKKKGLTLIELVLAISMMAGVLAIVYASYLYLFSNIKDNLQRSNAHLQVDYALENIRTHCVSAMLVHTLFPSGRTSEQNEFRFRGEKNVYNVTPEESSDTANYGYSINGEGALVLSQDGVPVETLIDQDFSPVITFSYTEGSEPNYMNVTIEADFRPLAQRRGIPSTSRFKKSESIRFWFVDVVN